MDALLFMVYVLKDSWLFILIIIIDLNEQLLSLINPHALLHGLCSIIPPERIHSGPLEVPCREYLEVLRRQLVIRILYFLVVQERKLENGFDSGGREGKHLYHGKFALLLEN